MAKEHTQNGPGHNSQEAPEKQYFDRLVEIERQMEALREERKVVCIEAKEEDILVMPLKLAVKLYLETQKERVARLSKQQEAERMLRSWGEFINTPLGGAAAARERELGEPGEDIGAAV